MPHTKKTIGKVVKHNLTKKNKLSKDVLEICAKEQAGNKSWEEEYQKSFAYKNLTQANRRIEKELIRMFKIPYAPSAITPRSNYYEYINHIWITEQSNILKKVDKFYVQIDSFRMAQEKVYIELIDITKEFIAKNHTPKAKTIRNVYESFLNLNESVAKSHVKTIVDTIDQHLSSNNLIKFLATINKHEIVAWGCPITWALQPDEKNAKIYTNYVSPYQMSLYDYSLYLDPEPGDVNAAYKKLIKTEYLKYINQLFTACLGANHTESAQDVWDVECDLLQGFECEEIPDENDHGYNVIRSNESVAKLGFDWHAFATELGYKKVPETFVATSLNFTLCTMRLLEKNWRTPKWRSYWLYIYFRQLTRFHKTWRSIWFNFNEKLLKGQPVMFPSELYPIFGLSACFNTFLTNEYIDRNHKPTYIQYIKNMAVDMKMVFERKIKRNTWLSPSTKKSALLKLKHLDLVVGSPKLMHEDPVINYSNNDPWGNLFKLSLWRTNQSISLYGKHVIDIPAIDWSAFKLVGNQSYIVNAFYTSTQNAIYIPLAYMQKPFIDLDERGIEYNLAHVGFTLGHEMSHALDNMGSQYDHNGNLHDWWTPSDKKIFNQKVQEVIKQYEQFARYDGLTVDASISTGENLADISGLAICEEYLRDFQDKNEDTLLVRKLSFEAFFCYYAIQARQKIYNKAFAAQIKTNPHPMDVYRTNCPLSRLELFKSIYNIKKGDKMYWPNNDTIW